MAALAAIATAIVTMTTAENAALARSDRTAVVRIMLLALLRGVLPLGARWDDAFQPQIDRHRAVHLVAMRDGAEQEEAFGHLVRPGLGQRGHVVVFERGQGRIAVRGRFLEQRDELRLAARGLFLVLF